MGFAVLLNGYSGSGKSALAQALERKIILSGTKMEILDGDDVRKKHRGGLAFPLKIS